MEVLRGGWVILEAERERVGDGADGGSGDFGGGPYHVMTMNWQLRVHAARNIRHSLLS